MPRKTILDGPVSLAELLKRNPSIHYDRAIRQAVNDPNTPTWVLNMIRDTMNRSRPK